MKLIGGRRTLRPPPPPPRFMIRSNEFWRIREKVMKTDQRVFPSCFVFCSSGRVAWVAKY
jgi:hypothetical protein